MAPKSKQADPKAKAKAEGKAKAKAESAKKDEEAKKRKAEEKPEASKKEAKTEAGQTASTKEPVEKDAPADSRAALDKPVVFEPAATTLNVLPSLGGKVLMTLSDGGMSYLTAGARANVGVKAGRYMFEIKIVEALAPPEVPMAARKAIIPKQLVRVGFSTASEDLLFGTTEGAKQMCVDSEGMLNMAGQKTMTGTKFGKEHVVALVLNLDPKSANANTVTLYRDGKKATESYKLPEALVGQALYPQVNYRNCSVQVNFGPVPLKELPFKCRTLATAAKADVVVTPSPLGKDGKGKVVFPVGMPDKGYFDWVDDFMKQNPTYVELSDRKLVDWTIKSGWPKMRVDSTRESVDKPLFAFGIPAMEDLSCRRIINTVAPLVPRNYVVVEMKSNLDSADRAVNLTRFSKAKYSRTAKVVMGTPSDEFKEAQQALMLKAKQDKATAAWKQRVVDKKKKKEAAARVRQLEAIRKAADEKRKKAIEEAQKRAAAAKAKAEALKKEKAEKAEKEAKEKEAAEKAKEGGEEDKKDEDVKMEDAVKEEAAEGEEKKAEETKEEAKEDAKEETKEEPKEEAKEEPKEEAKEEAKKEEPESDEEPEPVAELTEEEKAKPFVKKTLADMSQGALASGLAKFSVPTTSEGFDDIDFEWDSEAACVEMLSEWVQEQKRTCRLDNLVPGTWFEENFKAWSKTLKEYQSACKTYQANKKPKKEGDEEEEEPDVVISDVEDIKDVGGGKPLFADFIAEDWILAELRMNLYLCVQGFLKDCGDDERTGMPEKHLDYYYAKYFKRQLVPKLFNVEKMSDVLTNFAKQVVNLTDTGIVELNLEGEQESCDVFVKFAAETRRERQRRIDAGDETAKIKFQPNCLGTSVPVVKTNQPGLVGTPVSQASTPTAASPTAAGVVRPVGASPRPRGGAPSWPGGGGWPGMPGSASPPGAASWSW
eukprot:TRINITY_DN90614_c0_g1_i1.p1 TRINITY_DN90614_c0_g1~~TRINITY_DN90614_c0_g1_i1.p1  ORF type:complete len:956 (+),score=362.14 TRINITY_DN90614_c0_g1_i1:57-2870(+)